MCLYVYVWRICTHGKKNQFIRDILCWVVIFFKQTKSFVCTQTKPQVIENKLGFFAVFYNSYCEKVITKINV